MDVLYSDVKSCFGAGLLVLVVVATQVGAVPAEAQPGVDGQAIAASYRSGRVGSGDFDGDGQGDQVTFFASSQNQVEVKMATGVTLEHVIVNGYSIGSGDFNGDGFDELVVGVFPSPGDLVPVEEVVLVFAGTASGPDFSAPQKLSQAGVMAGTPEPYESFGFSFASGDFNGDGFEDLAIGNPGEDFGRYQPDVGIVNLAYGSPAGLVPSPEYLSQAGAVLGRAEWGDEFGFSLASGDFDGDGFADLAIGVPGEDVELDAPPWGIENVGGVNVVYGTSNGLDLHAPGQYYGPSKPTANAVAGLALAAGNFFGGCDGLAVGIPGWASGTGGVTVLPGTPTGLDIGDRTWVSQRGPLKGYPEPGDIFGRSVAAGDHNGDGHADLIVAAPREDLGSAIDMGVVHLVAWDTNRERSDELYTEHPQGVPYPSTQDRDMGYGSVASLNRVAPGTC